MRLEFNKVWVLSVARVPVIHLNNKMPKLDKKAKDELLKKAQGILAKHKN